MNTILWLILGLLVTGVSWYLGDKFVLFFYVGVVFLAIALFKTILYFIMRESPEDKQYRYVCKRCKKTVSKNDKFCGSCGNRLRA